MAFAICARQLAPRHCAPVRKSGLRLSPILQQQQQQHVRCLSTKHKTNNRHEAAGPGLAGGIYELDGPGDHAISPRIADSAWVAPNAIIIGDVEIGEDASIWWNTVIRGDKDLIRIGARTNIQDGCVLHTDAGIKMEIGEGCTVGHMAMLHGCTIHDNTLIGLGATILNKAEIGPNCLVGANALVTENKKIPQGSLVTGVNKVARHLNENEIEGLRRSANGYVANSKRYQKTMVKKR